MSLANEMKQQQSWFCIGTSDAPNGSGYFDMLGNWLVDFSFELRTALATASATLRR